MISCCVSLPRLAPSAERTDDSIARSVVLAMNRFATFVQAINSIRATPAISIKEAFFAEPANASCSDLSCGGGSVALFFARSERKPVHVGGKCSSRLRPLDARVQSYYGRPAIVARGKLAGLPENGLIGIVETRRRNTDDRKRLVIDSNRGA